jgi:hypothetical protein
LTSRVQGCTNHPSTLLRLDLKVIDDQGMKGNGNKALFYRCHKVILAVIFSPENARE